MPPSTSLYVSPLNLTRVACYSPSSQTGQAVVSFLTGLKSSRAEEYREACDAKFELSTVFKSAEQLAELRKEAVSGGIDSTPADAEVAP